MLGRKRAPNFVYDREEIHAIARYYQERLEEEGRFDEIDLARRALQLFQKTGYENGRFSYDFIACDEVQDFSDIQLALIFRLVDSCRNLLLAGDTRQIINPSGFRWEEVRARFYERGVEVPEVIYLTLNFRCVGNVVRLANALLDLKRRLVGLSGSERREEWKFSGKPPVLVHGLEERQVLDLAGITGAGQVFLVRSSAEASMLKKALGTELVFTLHEAKGLEFDTVFLWKFGCDRKAAAVWRKIKKGLSFDRDHPHIRHEINLLYVAVTRARSTLIVYDGPGPADVWKMDELEGLLFRTGSAEDLENAWRRVSTPAEWEEQGDYFFERERYRAAAECYKNAGDAANEEKARAFVLELEGDHWAAAPLFERHGYPDRAAASYEQAGDPERALALWEALGEQERARQCRIRMHEIHRDFELAAAELEKSGDTEGALRNWERAGNHLQAARCRYRMKRFEQAAQSFEKAGAVDDACRCYTKLKQHSKAAELYFRSGRFEQAASLYRKLKNTDMLARCLEKTGDLYQLALLHQKAKRIKEAVACFEKFAAESDENRARLLAEAVSYEGRRTALKAALRYSALGAYADSAPLLHKKGYFKAALRDYERAGNHEGAAACHDALGDHYMEALEIEKSSHPDRENLAFLALHKHLAMAFESPRRAANILFAEADRFMKGGDYVRALTRYKVLQHAEGVCQAYLHLDRDDEALDYLISRGLLEEADDYLDKPGLTVTTRALEAAFRDLRTERSWRDFGTVDVIVHLLIRIGTACLRHDAGTALVVQRIVSYLSRHHFFDFKRFFPAEYLALALDLGNCNALFRVLDLNLRVGWSKTGSESIEGEPAAFLAAVRETAQMRKDKSLLALYYYFYDPQRFETVLGELDIGGLEIEQFDAEQLFADQQTDSADVPFNYELFANSGSHYTRAARYLAASGKVKHAARVCIIRRDLLEAARIHEQAGDLKSAGRYYRDGKDYQRALACFRKLDDTAGMARVYERMGEYAQAVEIWERLGRERDAGRVRKKLDQAKANTDQGSLFEQDGPDG
jgi:tetratricopeptide (TPR) repeat protein